MYSIAFCFCTYFRHKCPETGECSHNGMTGVAFIAAFGCVALFLVGYFEVRCNRGHGFKGIRVRVRDYLPNVSLCQLLSLLSFFIPIHKKCTFLKSMHGCQIPMRKTCKKPPFKSLPIIPKKSNHFPNNY